MALLKKKKKKPSVSRSKQRDGLKILSPCEPKEPNVAFNLNCALWRHFPGTQWHRFFLLFYINFGVTSADSR